MSRYGEFLRSTSGSKPLYWDQVEHENLPIIGVEWHDADSYCRWTGKRLPTEAEWEKAARGMDGRTYPWGNEEPTPRLANFGKVFFFLSQYEGGLAPVDSYEPGKSPYGLHHMAGNVWEWVADWYGESYYGSDTNRNPAGPLKGDKKVLRGGSWDDRPVHVRSALRLSGAQSPRLDDIGFRCAQDIPK